MARPIVEQVSPLDGVTTEGFLDATSNFGACAGIWDAGFGEAENGIGGRRTRSISTRENAEFYESPRVELEGIEPSSVRWSRDALRPFP